MQSQKRTAAALGFFDGVHLGHRSVLAAAYQQKSNGLVPCAFTFPAEFASGKKSAASGYLYTTEQKKHILRQECGMKSVICPPFSEVCMMEGETFVREILCEKLHAAYVCCGEDFRFGHRAACGVQELRVLGERYGFAVDVIPEVCADGKSVSSGAIRQFLLNGEMEQANALLGSPYCIRQTVTHGAQLGRTIGFPTANQIFAKGQLVPRFGVYASETIVDGVNYPSLTNIGMKPTVQYDGMPLAETYIIGFAGDLYGKDLQVILHRFVRPEQKFSSVSELTAQMQRDLAACVKE